MPKQATITGEANLLLEKHLEELGLKFEKEFAFAPPRKWRFDYRLESRHGLFNAIEIDGGIYTQGRHNRGVGFQNDLIKMREAAVRGWRVFRFSTGEVLDGTARKFIQQHCL